MKLTCFCSIFTSALPSRVAENILSEYFQALTLLSELQIIFFPQGKVHLRYYLNDRNCYINCL